ncbi:hypothetical protein Dda_3222 [Drechslerella dactyloides]|uniref:Uncharacterized protein n=1 Tax=Drechslerella dactyloides TaxID=74499 RepID=A0AAD6J2I1_DREDA|nr:hypothetical protein Dda_3222 [Drechslerella dactyloides]
MPDTTVLPLPSGSCDSPSPSTGGAPTSTTNISSSPSSTFRLIPTADNLGPDDSPVAAIVENSPSGRYPAPQSSAISYPSTPAAFSSASVKSKPLIEDGSSSIKRPATAIRRNPSAGGTPAAKKEDTRAVTSYYSTLAQRQIKNLSNQTTSPSFTVIEGPCSIKHQETTAPSQPSGKENNSNTSGYGHTSNRASISISSVNPLVSLANLARTISGAATTTSSSQSNSNTNSTNATQPAGRKRTLSSRRKSDGSILKKSSYDSLRGVEKQFPPPGLTLAEVLETTGNHAKAAALDSTKAIRPNMHQSSSRLLRMTQDDRPFTRDFKDLFSTLIVSLPLTPHRLRFKTYPFTFTSDQAVNNLGSLKFSQSNRMPDPKDPSRIVTTTTTTTFSMAKEMARTVCQKFVSARFMEAVGEKPGTPFTSKNTLWQLTPKGIHVLERFCQRNGINSQHIMALLASPYNTMRLVILERDAITDKVSQDKSTTEIIFRRFTGVTPNTKATLTASDSDSLSEYGDGQTGVKLAESRKIHDKVYKHSFTGKAAVDWLLDCCTTIEPTETHEIAGLFVTYGLIQCVLEDKIYMQQEPKGKTFQPTKSAIYVITERGKRVAGWIEPERGSLENGKGRNGNSLQSSQGSRSGRGKDAGESRETNTTRLSCILADPALRLLFREFLRETLCEENLSFWLDVNDFSHQFNALNQKTLDHIRETLAAAYGIYNAFLAPGSPCELNIDHTLRQDLAARMTRAVAKDEQAMLVSLKEVATLFERAQEQVFKLMASDSVPKFARTARYIEMSGDHLSDDGSAHGIAPPGQQRVAT